MDLDRMVTVEEEVGERDERDGVISSDFVLVYISRDFKGGNLPTLTLRLRACSGCCALVLPYWGMWINQRCYLYIDI